MKCYTGKISATFKSCQQTKHVMVYVRASTIFICRHIYTEDGTFVLKIHEVEQIKEETHQHQFKKK